MISKAASFFRIFDRIFSAVVFKHLLVVCYGEFIHKEWKYWQTNKTWIGSEILTLLATGKVIHTCEKFSTSRCVGSSVRGGRVRSPLHDPDLGFLFPQLAERHNPLGPEEWFL